MIKRMEQYKKLGKELYTFDSEKEYPHNVILPIRYHGYKNAKYCILCDAYHPYPPPVGRGQVPK